MRGSPACAEATGDASGEWRGVTGRPAGPSIAGPVAPRRRRGLGDFPGRRLGCGSGGGLLGLLFGRPLLIGVPCPLQLENSDLGGLQVHLVRRPLCGHLGVGTLLGGQLRVGLRFGGLGRLLGGGHLVAGGASGGVGVGLSHLGELELAENVHLVDCDVVEQSGALDQFARSLGAQQRGRPGDRRPVHVAVAGEPGDAGFRDGDGSRRCLELGCSLFSHRLGLQERFLGDHVGRPCGLGLDADAFELGFGDRYQAGDTADLGRRSRLLGLRGTDLAVRGVGRRGRCETRRRQADERNAGEHTDQRAPHRTATARTTHCRPAVTWPSSDCRAGPSERTVMGHGSLPGEEGGGMDEPEQSPTNSDSSDGNTRHTCHSLPTAESRLGHSEWPPYRVGCPGVLRTPVRPGATSSLDVATDQPQPPPSVMPRAPSHGVGSTRSW